ncbi:hypothetical protein [Bdellovibrio bacteriovorus]|nr:hypothetical protein [Bdellovibrio bacteriovorus]
MIKMPALMAVVVILGVGLVTFLDDGMPQKAAPLICKIENEGHLKYEGQPVSFASHLFRSSDGRYYFGGLDSKSEKWRLMRIGFSQEMAPYLEQISSSDNDLLPGGGDHFSLVGSFGNVAVVRGEYEGREKYFPVVISEEKIQPKSSMALCNLPWSPDAEWTQLNDKNLLVTQGGVLGFYDVFTMKGLVPRGGAQTPDSILTVGGANALTYSQCSELQGNSKARVRISRQVIAYTSGDKPEISVYQSDAKELSLKPSTVSLPVEFFGSFMVAGKNFFGHRISGMLDAGERWQFSPLVDGSLDSSRKYETLKPVDFKRVTDEDGNLVEKDLWLAEEARENIFWRRSYVSRLIEPNQVVRYSVGFKLPPAKEKFLWEPMPGGRHLFVMNKDDVSYKVIKCD